jgi:mono/diheme cytochrome c family protein
MARSLALALATLVALFALAGCGGEETVSPEAETVEGTLSQESETTPDLEGGDAEAGAAVFDATGCGSCHTFEAAGSTAEIGPNLDDALQGQDAQFIYTSIVDPNAEVAEGFSEGIMPANYGEQLDEQELVDLVAFLQGG